MRPLEHSAGHMTSSDIVDHTWNMFILKITVLSSVIRDSDYFLVENQYKDLDSTNTTLFSREIFQWSQTQVS